MTRSLKIRMLLTCLLSVFLCATVSAQITAQGTINGQLVNLSGITIFINSDSAGVPLSGSGTAAATLNFGNISASGALSTGVVRSGVSSTQFTVSTPFDIEVGTSSILFGGGSNSFSLTAQLQSPAPTGLTYTVDGKTISQTAVSLTTNGAYSSNVQHTLGLVVLTAAPGSGGPATNTPLSTTIQFVATAN